MGLGGGGADCLKAPHAPLRWGQGAVRTGQEELLVHARTLHCLLSPVQGERTADTAGVINTEQRGRCDRGFVILYPRCHA